MKVRTKNILYNLLALLLGLVFVFLILAAGEIFLRLRHKRTPGLLDIVQHNLADFTIPDPVMGMKHLPGFSGSHFSINRGEEIFRAHYEINNKGYRITPVDYPEDREKAALFFGCSFMFGLGVEQEETLPACFGRENEDFLPLNFAVGGYGPQHLWLQMEQDDFLDQMPRDSGVIVYGFFSDHIDRLLGKYMMVEDWGSWLPWLSVEDGEVVNRGFMHHQIVPESKMMKLLQPFHMAQFVLNRLGLKNQEYCSPEEGMDEMVAFLLLVKKRFTEILPGYEFVVLSYPWIFEVEGFAECMKKAGIPFFNYTTIYPDQDVNQDKYFYKDGFRVPWAHPKANVYADVAKWLTADLKTLYEEKETEKTQEVKGD